MYVVTQWPISITILKFHYRFGIEVLLTTLHHVTHNSASQMKVLRSTEGEAGDSGSLQGKEVLPV